MDTPELLQLQAPVVHPGAVSLHVGPDVLPGTGKVVEYLIDDAGPDGYVRRFGAEPPIVRVAEGATPTMVKYAIRAVEVINASLPDTWQCDSLQNLPRGARHGHGMVKS